MKTMKYLLLTAVIVGGLFALNTQAGPGGNKQGGKRAEAKERAAKIADELGLNAEQKEKIKPILKEEREKLQGLKDLTPGQRRERIKEVRKETAEKLKPILTTEQLEKWRKLREQRGGKRGAKTQDKK